MKPGGGIPGPLRRPTFRLLLGGMGASYAGDQLQRLGQSWLVTTLTGSATSVGLIAVFATVPLLLYPLAGVIVEQVDRRRFFEYMVQDPGNECRLIDSVARQNDGDVRRMREVVGAGAARRGSSVVLRGEREGVMDTIGKAVHGRSSQGMPSSLCVCSDRRHCG